MAAFGSSTAWWGVDPSSRGLSIAWATCDDDGTVRRGVRSAMWPQDLHGGRLLATVYREARDLAYLIALKPDARPGVILVEQPSGAQPNPVLSYAVGVAQAAIYEGALNATGVVPHIETCTSSWWKKRACGNGAIRKPKRRADGEYGVLAWAHLNGYPGTSWDEADALAIAEAARREIALEQR